LPGHFVYRIVSKQSRLLRLLLNGALIRTKTGRRSFNGVQIVVRQEESTEIGVMRRYPH